MPDKKDFAVSDAPEVHAARGFDPSTEDKVKKYKVVDGTSFDFRTPDDVCNMLNNLRNNHTRVQVVYGDKETGKVWESVTPERGTIGRSMGPNKIPLLVRTSRSLGGEGLLDHCILQIKESKGGKVLYTHPVLKKGVA